MVNKLTADISGAIYTLPGTCKDVSLESIDTIILKCPNNEQVTEIKKDNDNNKYSYKCCNNSNIINNPLSCRNMTFPKKMYRKKNDEYKEEDVAITDLKCWKNEQITNIKLNKDKNYYDYDCCRNIFTGTNSNWECKLNTYNGSSSYIIRKHESGNTQCSASTNAGWDCLSFADIAGCQQHLGTLARAVGYALPSWNGTDSGIICKANDKPISQGGGNDYKSNSHWCTLNYEELTKAGY